ncbi:MAG: hypothetical protein CMP10_03070 [Zetaproteobacteria bacterium]|nr:hypothetical protein [Pseudobdellovibrionaceae bacterium]|tara:strand:+ start:1513 stop:1836 length:324 start_codon:yes stop_codon:yes gene_type:complete
MVSVNIGAEIKKWVTILQKSLNSLKSGWQWQITCRWVAKGQSSKVVKSVVITCRVLFFLVFIHFEPVLILNFMHALPMAMASQLYPKEGSYEEKDFHYIISDLYVCM